MLNGRPRTRSPTTSHTGAGTQYLLEASRLAVQVPRRREDRPVAEAVADDGVELTECQNLVDRISGSGKQLGEDLGHRQDRGPGVEPEDPGIGSTLDDSELAADVAGRFEHADRMAPSGEARGRR